jgi:hypothetical protein
LTRKSDERRKTNDQKRRYKPQHAGFPEPIKTQGESMQTDMEYLEDTLRMGVAGGFINHSERENIVKYLAEPGVCAPLVLGANMHAACSRTSLI